MSPPADRLETNLNEEQRRGLAHGRGPLLIVAGAGTGKTRTITARAEYLVAQRGAAPEKILALTFGERAAAHLAEKLEEELGARGREIWASTFHSFCRKLLEQDGRRIGIPPGFRVLDSVETWMLLRELLPALKLKFFFELRDSAAYVSDFREFLGRCHDHLITPEDYLAYAHARAAQGAEDAEAEMEKARVYQAVDRRLRELGALTFGGLIQRAIELLRADAAVRRQWQERFQYILVDEFQDTNWAQIQLLKLLAERHHNVTVVGDHDQAIYRFRGASFASFKTFRDLFPGTRITELHLTTNYRSTDKILAAAHALIVHNTAEPGESHETLTPAQQGPSAPVTILRAPDPETEARAIGDALQGLIQEGFPPGEIAVIYRSRRHRESLTAELDSRGLAYEFRGKGDFFNLAEIGDLLAYARLAVNPEDENRDSLYRVLLRHEPNLDFTALVRLARFQEEENRRRRTPAAALAALRRSLQPLRGPDSAPAEIQPLVDRLENEARRLWGVPEAPAAPELSFLDALGQAHLVPGLSPEAVTCLQGLAQQVHDLVQAAATQSAEEFLFHVLEQTRLVSVLMQEGSRQAVLRLRNLGRLIRFVQDHQRQHPRSGMREFLAYLDLFQEAGGELMSDDDPIADAVQLMTVHGAKGLEYRAVFTIGLSEQRFPQYPRGAEAVAFPDALLREELPPTEYHWEEERRLCYVAMTRAKERLFLSTPSRKLSRFLKEIQESAAEVCELKEVTRHEGAELEEVSAFGERTRQLIQARARLLEKAAAEPGPALEAWIGELLAAGCKLSLLEAASRQGQTPGSLAAPWLQAAGSLPAAWTGRLRQEIQALSLPSPAPAPAAPERMLKLSHSKIKSYQECPLQYYFRETLPLVSAPAPHLAFGSWIHAVLENFYLRVMASEPHSLEDLLQIFSERYDPAVFEDPDQARGYCDQGEALLRAFFARHAGKFAPPLAVEKWISFELDGVKLTGKIDRMDPLPGGKEVEVLDYKTGSADKSEKELQKKADQDLQLGIYALGLQAAEGRAAGRLTLYYLEPGIQVSTTRSPEQLAAVRQVIAETAAGIRAKRFEAKPERRRCSYCDYCRLCEKAAK